jgi:hypothetical protein
MPGIRDKETLEIFSELRGEVDRKQWGETIQENPTLNDKGPTRTLGWHRVPRITRDRVHAGHPQSPDLALCLLQGMGIGYTWQTPYYRSAPWTHMLVRSGVGWAARHAPEVPLLRCPDLDRDGSGQHLKRLGLYDEWVRYRED